MASNITEESIERILRARNQEYEQQIAENPLEHYFNMEDVEDEDRGLSELIEQDDDEDDEYVEEDQRKRKLMKIQNDRRAIEEKVALLYAEKKNLNEMVARKMATLKPQQGSDMVMDDDSLSIDDERHEHAVAHWEPGIKDTEQHSRAQNTRREYKKYANFSQR